MPELSPEDPCSEETSSFIPSNVTHRQNLPDLNSDIIALAPWSSPDCVQSFLAAERNDPLSAAIFYLPGNSSSIPLSTTNSVWDLNDKGSWRSENEFPVYAISGTAGGELMHQLSQYSGNITQVPYGDRLVKDFRSDEYIRVYSVIRVASR